MLAVIPDPKTYVVLIPNLYDLIKTLKIFNNHGVVLKARIEMYRHARATIRAENPLNIFMIRPIIVSEEVGKVKMKPAKHQIID